MELLGESLFISLLVGLIVAWPLHKIVRLTGFGPISTVVAGMLGALIGIWFTPGARDIIPAIVELPLPKLPTLKMIKVPLAEASLPEVPESDLLSWAPAPFDLAMQPMAQLRPMMKPIVYRSREEICASLAEAIRSNDLPPHFFIRLLYQESSFRPYVISSAGALGIAQFMPETANERGLDNPFDPAQAIPASARLLRDLSRKFGNLGLAAAAYNAGPKRIQDWLANKGSAAAGDTGLRAKYHQLAGRDMDRCAAGGQSGGEIAAAGTVSGTRRASRLERTGRNSDAASQPACPGGAPGENGKIGATGRAREKAPYRRRSDQARPGRQDRR